MIKQNQKSARVGTKVSLKGGGDILWDPVCLLESGRGWVSCAGRGPGVGSLSPLTILLHFCYPA